MTDLQLYQALQNDTEVWFVENCGENDFDISKCHKGIIIFLGIKKDKTQVELLVGTDPEPSTYRTPSSRVFATKAELKKAVLKALTSAKNEIDSDLAEINNSD